jgi:uncharacterized protein YndB with AHSA1/START domain
MAAITIDAWYPRPAGDVWRGLTDPALLGQWLMPADGFRAEVGCRFTFDRGDGELTRCEVIEVDRGRRLSYRWTGRKGPGHPWMETTVSWTLVPEAKGTRLFLVHDGFDDNDPGQREALQVMGGGWRGHLTVSLARAIGAGPGGLAALLALGPRLVLHFSHQSLVFLTALARADPDQKEARDPAKHREHEKDTGENLRSMTGTRRDRGREHCQATEQRDHARQGPAHRW